MHVDRWQKKCSASLTIDVNTKKITKVNGKQWDQETPLKDFHDHSCLTHSESVFYYLMAIKKLETRKI
jgi:hypothetical protein